MIFIMHFGSFRSKPFIFEAGELISIRLNFHSALQEFLGRSHDTFTDSKSSGLDSIDTLILKLAGPNIFPALTHIINLSIATQQFPSSWKIAKVIPLFKKDNPLNPKNYRPVAICLSFLEWGR